MKGIVLVSHGHLAEGMLDAVKMFAGEPEQIEALGFMPGQEMGEFALALRQAVEHVDTGDGVVVFCDLLFGSPCNCSGMLLRDPENLDRVQVVTGVNLPMVIEYVTARGFGMDVETLIQTGRDGITDYNELHRARMAKA